jgi:hypothetical protein
VEELMSPYLAHLIGDFILQTDYMAAGKKRSYWICVLHIMTYMLPFLLCDLSPRQFLAIGIQHFFQDHTNFIVWLMRVKGSAGFAQPPMAPWSIILTDNIIHIVWIAAVVNGSIGRF